MKRTFARPQAASCTGNLVPAVGSNVLGVPQIVIIVLVFAWTLVAVLLGTPEGSLIGVLSAAGTVSAHLIGRSDASRVAPGL